MKEWGSDPDEEPDGSLLLEAVVVGISVVGAYLLGVSLLAG